MTDGEDAEDKTDGIRMQWESPNALSLLQSPDSCILRLYRTFP